MHAAVACSLTAAWHRRCAAHLVPSTTAGYVVQAVLLLQQLTVGAIPDARVSSAADLQQVGSMMFTLLRPLYVYGVSAVQSEGNCESFVQVRFSMLCACQSNCVKPFNQVQANCV